MSPTASTTLARYARSTGLRAMSRGSVMFSSAVSVGTRLNDWKTNPSWVRRSFVSCRWFMPETTRSSTTTVPAVGESSPAMQCMRVDLPEPEGPMIAVKRPRPKSTSTPASAWTAVGPLP
ncbi:hypothetical protein D3C74_396480 [compost metagenome]